MSSANTGEPDLVEARVADLERALSELIDHVGELTNQIAASTPSGSRPAEKNADMKAAPWLHSRPDGDTLAAWVEWFNGPSGYAPRHSERIPECWAEHSGLVAELSTLWACWKAAFLSGEKGSCEAAQAWHDRWLPGMLARRQLWSTRGCADGTHRTGS